jgi:hypothetical protein
MPWSPAELHCFQLEKAARIPGNADDDAIERKALRDRCQTGTCRQHDDFPMVFPVISSFGAGRRNETLALLREDGSRHDGRPQLIFEVTRPALTAAKALHEVNESNTRNRESAQNLDESEAPGRFAAISFEGWQHVR